MALNVGVTHRAISPKTEALARRFEANRPTAYDDKQPDAIITDVNQVKGVPTIGLGHTRGVTAQDIVNKRTISQAQIDALFADDMEGTVAVIYEFIPAKRIDAMSENQWAAVVDFCFNCGLPKKLVQLWSAGRYNEMCDHMALYVTSRGVRMQGLVDRRRAETDLWKEAETMASNGSANDIQPLPPKPLLTSRTFISATAAGLGSVGTGTAVAVNIIAPHSDGNPVLTTMLTACVSISAVCGFAAAFFRFQDTKGGQAL